jgi:DNA invertase Pin-like site-specific DNA recombinase
MSDRRSNGADHRQRKLRCALYTRKSSEEGLEQDFNSLDAQREACEAFVASQKREGWVLLPEMYDDGGFSGGTLERPAFQRLLADVSAGKVDVVVVYKVDRLTRSLSDFAKIVEVFDKNGVSFVSVTQQFNTTSSMGRLTLNILLSFAQFEREVTGERIRDKIAASKKKGMWMGGQPPLGYDVKDRKLVVNTQEAETVRQIFRRYLELKSVRLLKADLDAHGIVSKARMASDGSAYGSKPLARGALYLMLQNRIYRGETVHKDKSYPGEHDAIVDERLWNEVQVILRTNRIERADGRADNRPSMLAGLLFDAQGERMSPSHANKRGTRYRYYISRSLIDGTAKTSIGGQRIPAVALEALIVRNVRQWFADPGKIHQFLGGEVSDAIRQKRLIDRANKFAATWNDLSADDVHVFIRAVTARVQVHAERIEVALERGRLLRWLDGKRQDDDRSTGRDRSASESDSVVISIPVRLRRAGKEMRLVVDDGSEQPHPDPALIRLVIRAHGIRDQLLHDRSLMLEEIAKSHGFVPSYATRLFRLTLLAPDIVAAVLGGRQPPELTARKLMDDTRLPLDWNEQRRTLGFVQPL